METPTFHICSHAVCCRSIISRVCTSVLCFYYYRYYYYYIIIIIVVIIDPGIKVDDHYETYSNGLQMDIFIKVLYITDYNYTTCF